MLVPLLGGGFSMTGHITKPGVDWGAIEAGYRAGKSCRQLAKDYPGISHVAIAKRARKSGWSVDAAVETAMALTQLTTGSLPETYKGTDERRAAILQKLAAGSTLDMAAKAAGITPDTLRSWRRSDTEFGTACDRAQVAWAERQVGHIDKAADRGDWRASSWLMERHPATRDEFGQQATKSGGPTVRIELAINRFGDAVPVVDVTPNDPQEPV